MYDLFMNIMMSRRSTFQMYADVLTEIKNGTVLPTRIMYATNLNWKTFRKILGMLKVQGFIDEQPLERDKRSKNIYTLTNKGNNVLNYLNKVTKLLEPEKTILSIKH